MPNELQLSTPQDVALINREEIDIQIATAKMYPRNELECVEKSIKSATRTADIAMCCNYRLERKDKTGKIKIIEGPSIRCVELCVKYFTNSRSQFRIVEETPTHITAEGAFFDLENNSAWKAQVTKLIVSNKTGKRYTEDMVNMTKGNAGMTALRNAARLGLPDIVSEVAAKAKEYTIKHLTNRIGDMVKKFKGLGISEKEMLGVVKKEKLSEIKTSDIERLVGYYVAIKEGHTTKKEAITPASEKELTVPTVVESEEQSEEVKEFAEKL